MVFRQVSSYYSLTSHTLTKVLSSLYGNGKDDLVGWFDRPDGSVAYGVWRNRGNYNDASFVKIGDLNVADNCPASGVYFVDLNGSSTT